MQTVERYRDAPATLFWMLQPAEEDWQWEDPRTAQRLHELAEAIRQRDPLHPLTLELPASDLASIQPHLPRLQIFDALGISLFGFPEVPIAQRLLEAGWTKPYFLSAFGPARWQTRLDASGRIEAPPSNQVAEELSALLDQELKERPGLLGGFFATWNFDPDGTQTYGLPFLEGGATFALFDRLQQAWTGIAPARPAPQVERLVLEPGSLLAPGSQVDARIVGLADTSELQVQWILTSDSASPEVGVYRPEIISRRQTNRPRVVYGLPYAEGRYRLHAIVTDVRRKAASVSAPITIRGGNQN